MEKLLELLMGLDFQHQRSLSSALNWFGSGGSIDQHGRMSEIDPMDQGQGAQSWSIDRVGVVGMGLIGGSIALDLSPTRG
jgi:phosphoglycerate dehydrogenase-like enzyme